MNSEMGWLRVRFQANKDDPRPVTFPPPGPFWVTGYGDSYAIVVAYVRELEEVEKFWPETKGQEFSFIQPRDEITFTDRFAEPEWWRKQRENAEQ